MDHECGNDLYSAVIRILAPEIVEAGMTNKPNLGDIVEMMLALDHRETYTLPDWQVHGEVVTIYCNILHICAWGWSVVGIAPVRRRVSIIFGPFLIWSHIA